MFVFHNEAFTRFFGQHPPEISGWVEATENGEAMWEEAQGIVSDAIGGGMRTSSPVVQRYGGGISGLLTEQLAQEIGR